MKKLKVQNLKTKTTKRKEKQQGNEMKLTTVLSTSFTTTSSSSTAKQQGTKIKKKTRNVTTKIKFRKVKSLPSPVTVWILIGLTFLISLQFYRPTTSNATWNFQSYSNYFKVQGSIYSLSSSYSFKSKSSILRAATSTSRATLLTMINTNKKYVVWMFPFPPPPPPPPSSSEPKNVNADEVLICAYSFACNQDYEQFLTINIRDLTQNTYYENYIRDHAYHKVRHMIDFPYHIQAITMLSLLLLGNGTNGTNSNPICARSLGSQATTTKFCDFNSFRNYDPYNQDMKSTNYPYQLLQSNFMNDGDESSLSIVPQSYISNQERFAMWGWEDGAIDKCKVFNSGEDVQSYAGASWLPYITDIRQKHGAIHNYTGYYIGNALMGGHGYVTASEDYGTDRMKKISLVSIYAMHEGIKDMMTYLQLYTEGIEPFGCRSLATERILKARMIKSYFSACLTLTTNMQGATFESSDVDSISKKNYLNHKVLKPPPTSTITPITTSSPYDSNLKFNNTTNTKTKVIIVDVVDPSVVPKSVRESPDTISLPANIASWYKVGCYDKMDRYDYSYKLMSLYANQAKVLITSRIHAGLPATALGVPVIFVEKSNGWLPGGKQKVGRVEGLLDVFHRVEKGVEGKEWIFGDLREPIIPKSNGVHLADRYRASFWHRLKKTHYYHDTAKLFGMVPILRIGTANTQLDIQEMFHLMLTLSDLTWQTRRVIEHIFVYHPNSKVYIHLIGDTAQGNNKQMEDVLEIFVETGYDLVVLEVDHDARQENLAYPLHVLQEYGGIFVSKNTLILKELSINIEEGYLLEESGSSIAVAYYRKDSQRVMEDLNKIERKNEINNNDHVSWSFPVLSELDTTKCTSEDTWSLPQKIEETIAISLHPESYASVNSIKIDTECYRAVEVPCIFCDEIHWDF